MNNHLFVLSFLACWNYVVKGGLISTYSLLTPHQLVPQQAFVPHSYSQNSLEFVQPQVHSGFEARGLSLANPEVLETAQEESHLPNELTKSRKFYTNPYVASALAEESLNFKKEEVTFDRPTQQIERHQIAKLIHNLDRVHNEPHH